MRGATIAVLGWLAALTPGWSYAVTGNDWQKWNEDTKTAYVSGVVDTWKHVAHRANEYRATEFTKSYSSAVDCLKGRRPYSQISAIVEKWMKDHPEHWHYELTSLVWEAVHHSCPARK